MTKLQTLPQAIFGFIVGVGILFVMAVLRVLLEIEKVER